MADNKTADIKMSTASKTRKSLSKLQKMKDEGEKICQVCPAELGPFFALAAEMVGCDVFRVPGILSVRAGALQNTNWDAEWTNSQLSVIKYREYSKIMHLNFYLPIQFYADKVDAVKYGAQLIFDGADSILPMGVTNEVLKYMSDNWVPTYGHIGAISGWQTNATILAQAILKEGFKNVAAVASFVSGVEFNVDAGDTMMKKLKLKRDVEAIPITNKLVIKAAGMAMKKQGRAE